MFTGSNFLRLASTAAIAASLLVAIVGAQDCPFCSYPDDGNNKLSQECIDSNQIVEEIISRDSSCGRNWDPFCIVEYNDCYNQACGPDQQAAVDEIAESGGPQGRPINRTQILLNCPPGATIPPTSEAPTACPIGKGKGGKKGGKKGGFYYDSYYGGKKGGKKGGFYYGKGKGASDPVLCACAAVVDPVMCGPFDVRFSNQCQADCAGWTVDDCEPATADAGKGKGGKKGGKKGGFYYDSYYGGKKGGKKGGYYGGKKGGKKGSDYYCDCIDDYYTGKKGGKGGKKGGYCGKKGGKKGGYYGGKKGGYYGGKKGGYYGGKKGGKKTGYYGGKGGKKTGYYNGKKGKKGGYYGGKKGGYYGGKKGGYYGKGKGGTAPMVRVVADPLP